MGCEGGAWKDHALTAVFGADLQLERRNYNAFALFGHSGRAQEALHVERLGCMRSGWPVELAFGGGLACGFTPEPDDPNLHSRHHCSLDGLFAVDWEVYNALGVPRRASGVERHIAMSARDCCAV